VVVEAGDDTQIGVPQDGGYDRRRSLRTVNHAKFDVKRRSRSATPPTAGFTQPAG
jgi:hypothetical protein